MDDWLNATLSELCIIGDGNHSSKYPKKSEMVEDGVPFIRGTNLVEGQISDKAILYISEEKHKQLKKGHLEQNDVLFTNRGEIGKVATVDEKYHGANCNSQLAWFRCREHLRPKYLFYFLQSERMRMHFSRTKSGAALQQFTIRMIKSVVLHLLSRRGLWRFWMRCLRGLMLRSQTPKRTSPTPANSLKAT